MSQPAAILKIASRADADALVRDIRRAVRNSTRTGGGYGVYRRDDAGDYAVAIEVNISQLAIANCQLPIGKETLWPRLSQQF